MKYQLFGAFVLLLLGTSVSPAQPTLVPLAAPTPAAVIDPSPACGNMPGGSGPEDGGLSPRLSVRGEYLLWWIKDAPSLPLLTTGDVSLSGLTAGQLSNADTSILLGKSRFGYPVFSGARLTAEAWLDSDESVGIQASGFLLEQHARFFHAAGDAQGNPVLARPIIDALTGTESVAAFVSFPAPFPGAEPAFAGSIAAASKSRLWGTELNLTGRLADSAGLRVNGLVGFRYLDLMESLDVYQNTTVLPNGLASFMGQFLLLPGDNLSITDSFGTRNQFYGGQIGAEAHYCLGKLSLDGCLKLAIGATHETIRISGITTLTATDLATPLSTPGGVLALPTNIGVRKHDEFAVVPEVGISVGYQLTGSLRASVGYTFLYWSDVVRPGNEATRVVNPVRIPSSAFFDAQSVPAAPAPFIKQVDFWAQGINLGLEFRY